MALQRMILVPRNCGKSVHSHHHQFKRYLKVKITATIIRLHQDQYLKTEKRKREPIPIPIIEKGNTKRKRIIGSVSLFKSEMLDSESESESLPEHSKYIDNVLKHKGSHDPTFGVYQDDKDGFLNRAFEF